MPEKLKYMLIPMKKAVVFCVIEMDERFRCNGQSASKTFSASNNIKIVSESVPELGNISLFLLGRQNDRDDNISIKYFKTKTERDTYIVNVHEALKEWAEKWEGWGNGAPADAEDEPYTYTV